MKVLQLHAGYRTPAGEDTVVHAEAAALRNAGHDVRQVIEDNPPSALPAVKALTNSLYNRPAAARVRAACDKFEPDIVHLHNTWFALSTSVIDAVASCGRPLVMTLHNYRLGCIRSDLFRDNSVCTTCVGRTPLSGVVHGCYRNSRLLSAVAAVEVMSTRRRSTLSQIDQFVAPTEFMADRLVDIGVPADRMVVKPHFTSDPGPRPYRPSESDEVLYIGRLASAKGIHTLLRAWERHLSALAPEQRATRRLTVMGEGPLGADLHEAAHRSVDFVGWMSHDEVRRRMLSARAFAFPSEWYEPFGLVLIEALAAGLPVIATTASDAVRITGTPPELVAPAGDDRALATCLGNLDDDTVDRVGLAGRHRFETTFAEAAGAADLEALYESVLAEIAGRTPPTGRRS